ncbi:MAG: hypothetical protein K2J67_05490 [Lachnospiraceae bacterium]|nr:hypothetical protein [Lachnospiraceae bacterium]
MAAEGSANKVSISDRDKKVLYILAGIIILALAYFFGFQKMMESRTALVEENVTLETEVNTLLTMVASKAKVEAETQKFKADTEKILAEYPPELRTQDVIYQLDLLEQGVKGLLLETESFTMNQIFFANGALTEGTVQDVAETPTEASGAEAAPAQITGYRSDVTTNCRTNYKSLKQIIDFFNNNTNKMTIDTITISRAEGEKELTCNMGVIMYAIGGTEEVYQSPNVTNSQIGKGELFAVSGK